VPTQKEQRSSATQERAQEEDENGVRADAGETETDEAGAPANRLSHAEQETLRRRLREKFH
jgi:hypothetical protein